MIGRKFDEEDIICAFENYEKNGEGEVIVKESENDGYDALAYINTADSPQFLFTILKGIVKEVKMIETF